MVSWSILWWISGSV